MTEVNIEGFLGDLDNNKLPYDLLIEKYIHGKDIEDYNKLSIEELKCMTKFLYLASDKYTEIKKEDITSIEKLERMVIQLTEKTLNENLPENIVFIYDENDRIYTINNNVDIRLEQLNYIRIMSHIYGRLGRCENRLSLIYIDEHFGYSINKAYEHNQEAISYTKTAISLDEILLVERRRPNSTDIEQNKKDKMHKLIMHKDIVLKYCLNEVLWYLKLNYSLTNPEKSNIKKVNIKQNEVKARITKYVKLILYHLEQTKRCDPKISYDHSKELFLKLKSKLDGAGINKKAVKKLTKTFAGFFWSHKN